MLYGFDTQTAPLSDTELRLIEFITPVLKRAVGKENAVYNQQIALACPEDIRPNPSRIRKIINHLRQTDAFLCLVATSKGYYIAESEQEVRDYEDSLRGRAEAIMAVCESMERQRKMMFGGVYQPKLF